jgi:hypoxanthine phosphoribosyltransferase
MASATGMGKQLLRISDSKYRDLILNVTSQVLESGFFPDVIVGIYSGGVVPARYMVDNIYPLLPDMKGGDGQYRKKPIMFTGVRSRFYDDRNQALSKPDVIQDLPIDIEGLRVQLVDDVSDSGLTGGLWVPRLKERMPKELIFTTLYSKPDTITVPDFYAEQTRDWIVFPGEEVETIEKLRKIGGMDDVVEKYFTSEELARYDKLVSFKQRFSLPP